ncbi:MAG: hypothetical protein ACJA1A_001701 [Saprospiraceae bacterium]|jgi:hypothetical protein|tara:strand:+ start:709 stop:1530 length:822 start_codon:yes stop_codon:yes gene_type:complete
MTAEKSTLYPSSKEESNFETLVSKDPFHMNYKLIHVCFCLLMAIILISPRINFAQGISPLDVIERSISYHDPEMQLFNSEVVMNFIETRPTGEDRNSKISFNIKNETFHLANNRDGISINCQMNKGKVEIMVDGKKEYSDEIMEKYRLNPKRIAMMKNYYQYLWLMPMKLIDPGTIVDSVMKKVDFFGKELLQIKISYSPDVGKDVWCFYFNAKSYAMQGYRFYHDESKNDGEYILLEGEAVFNNVRLPKKRTWYTHKEDKLLGTDILDKLSF